MALRLPIGCASNAACEAQAPDLGPAVRIGPERRGIVSASGTPVASDDEYLSRRSPSWAGGDRTPEFWPDELPLSCSKSSSNDHEASDACESSGALSQADDENCGAKFGSVDSTQSTMPESGPPQLQFRCGSHALPNLLSPSIPHLRQMRRTSDKEIEMYTAPCGGSPRYDYGDQTPEAWPEAHTGTQVVGAWHYKFWDGPAPGPISDRAPTVDVSKLEGNSGVLATPSTFGGAPLIRSTSSPSSQQPAVMSTRVGLPSTKPNGVQIGMTGFEALACEASSQIGAGALHKPPETIAAAVEGAATSLDGGMPAEEVPHDESRERCKPRTSKDASVEAQGKPRAVFIDLSCLRERRRPLLN